MEIKPAVEKLNSNFTILLGSAAVLGSELAIAVAENPKDTYVRTAMGIMAAGAFIAGNHSTSKIFEEKHSTK